MIFHYKNYKNRSLDVSKPVEIYRNLHNGLLSIRQSGLVIGHADIISLSNVKFIVNENKRLKVLEQKRKNVHAIVKGIVNYYIDEKDCNRSVFYNPYLYSNFVDENADAVYESKLAIIYSNGEMKIIS